jgi:hypothetical protein
LWRALSALESVGMAHSFCCAQIWQAQRVASIVPIDKPSRS